MDRFIEKSADLVRKMYKHLKSNMDRFIDQYKILSFLKLLDLKSNMDRFIEFTQLKKTDEYSI